MSCAGVFAVWSVQRRLVGGEWLRGRHVQQHQQDDGGDDEERRPTTGSRGVGRRREVDGDEHYLPRGGRLERKTLL